MSAVVATTSVDTARSAWTSPAPVMRAFGLPFSFDACAVLEIAALICAGPQVGCVCFTSTAMPDVIGAAIDVPDSTTPTLPVPTPADRTLTPGAETSGFGAESPNRGPPEEKLAARR